jgi:hypothetical protein
MVVLAGVDKNFSLDYLEDDYVPVKYANEKSQCLPIYFRTGDFESSLLELAVEPDTGKIIGLQLLLAGCIQHCKPVLELPEYFNKGVPILGAEQWEHASTLDEHNPIKVHIDNGEIIILMNSLPMKSLIVTGSLKFGFDSEDKLMAIISARFNESAINGN